MLTDRDVILAQVHLSIGWMVLLDNLQIGTHPLTHLRIDWRLGIRASETAEAGVLEG